MALNYPKNPGMTADSGIGKDIIEYLGKRRHVDPKILQSHSSQPDVAQIIHIQNFKKDATVKQELSDKLKCLIEGNSSNSLEKERLMNYVTDYSKKEKKKRATTKIVDLNGRRGQLIRVYGSESYIGRTLAGSQKVFDMSSLNESLPLGDEFEKKAEKLCKEYFEFREQKMQEFRKNEILRILNHTASEMNRNSSLKPHRADSISSTLKKVFGDVKNIHIFSFRPMIKTGKYSKSKKDSKRVGSGKIQELSANLQEVSVRKKIAQDLSKGRVVIDISATIQEITAEILQIRKLLEKKKFQKLSSRLEKLSAEKEKKQDSCEGRKLQTTRLKIKRQHYYLGKEVIVLIKSPYLGKKTEEKHRSKDTLNSKYATILRNPERLLFNKKQCDDEQQKSMALRAQLHDSVLLSRQLSRLKLVNSKRGDLLEDLDEFKIPNTVADQHDDAGEKVVIANRRKTLLEKLREGYRKHQQKEAQKDLMKN